jgi:hypothetical protein
MTIARTVITARSSTVLVSGSPMQIAVTQVTTGLTGRSGAGVPGAGGDLHHIHDQGSAAAVWLIAHALGKFPSVTVIDSAGDQVEGDAEYLDENTVRLTFGAAFAGRAYLN